MQRLGDHTGWVVTIWGAAVSVQTCVNSLIAGLTITVLVMQVIYSVYRTRKVKAECRECLEREAKEKECKL